ncbi:MAG: 3-phosphoshikimate 1-carboxyvinyltransferase [Kiritimatiellia bacterium]
MNMVRNKATVQPRRRLKADLNIPGDKSISHRAVMISAVAGGNSRISGFLESEDCLNTLNALRSLGAAIRGGEGDYTVEGTGGTLRQPGHPLDLGNSGTGMRLLSGILAAQDFASEMTGDESLRSRPMGRIKEPLEMMGAGVELTGERGCAPVCISGGPLRGVEYELPVASAQVKSCVLLAGLFAGGTTTVIEPRITRDHTERMLENAGADIDIDGNRISVKGVGGLRVPLSAGEWNIPGDFSTAAYWIAAGACSKDSALRIRDTGLNPTRTAFLEVLRRMGARVEITPRGDSGQTEWEPAGSIAVEAGDLRGTEVQGNEVPNMIDELPLVAMMGAFAKGVTVIRNAEELRVKESDRIAATVSGLSAMGVDIEEKPDGMIVRGGGGIRGKAAVKSYGDHRIAMTMAIAGLLAENPVEIEDIDCVSTSYPGFWETMEKL